jgi:DNA helicase-2/ATP-dependent DNA helicase PcrA
MPEVTPDQILAGLDGEQQLAATAVRGPVCIIAGAGTGKTRTVTHRIAYACLTGATTPQQVLAVTHSQKAAGELRARLRTLGVGDVTARTFHAAALRQLRYFWTAAGHTGELKLTDNRYALVRRALEQLAAESAKQAGTAKVTAVTKELVFDTAAEIGWAKSQQLTPGRYTGAASKAGRSVSCGLDSVAAAYRVYEKMKSKAGVLDFEDVLRLTAEMIEQNAVVAAQVRATYTYFVVDEYQDTDPLQQRLLDAWLGDRNDICVVGDPRQAIYSFKGADPKLIHSFTRRYPTAVVVRLVRDYRSTPQVVDVANRLSAAKASDALVGQRPDGSAPFLGPQPDDAAEERWIVQRIRHLLTRGLPASEIAVLYRFNAQSARLEQALTSAGVPYTVADTERFFARPEVLTVLRRFGAAARAEPGEIGVYLLRLALEEAGWVRDAPPAGAGAARDRWEALAALLGLVEAMPDGETLAARYLLAELRLMAAEQHSPGQATVTLSTIHKAKGLEWDAVFVARCVEGSLPSSYATTPAQLAEERRLLYVAATRARRWLHLSWSVKRDNGWKATPSRFLAELGRAGAPDPGSVTRRKRSV